MGTYDDDLLRYAVMHYRAKEFDTAKRYLERALDMADDDDTRLWGNFYLSQLTNDPAEKRQRLETVLAISPTHPEARKLLAILDGKLRPDEIVNPDALPSQSESEKIVQADRFTCPKCGGRMSYAPDGRSLVCEYCARNQTLQNQTGGEEQDFILAMATGKGHRKPVAMQTFHCQGCGADFLLPPQEKTSVCAYCGSNYVLQGDSRELIEPDSIIPMTFDQPMVMQWLREWAEKNKIQPEGKAKKPRGLYLPVWTFDLTGSIPWSGVVYRDKRSYPVSGTEIALINDIPIPATRRLGEQLYGFLKTYDFQTVTAYNPSYLAGWSAEVYDTAMGDASLLARQRSLGTIKEVVNRKQPGISNFSYSSSAISVTSFKLVFVPLWVTSYTLKGENYQVLVNGATGAIHGDKPAQGLGGWLESLLGGQE